MKNKQKQKLPRCLKCGELMPPTEESFDLPFCPECENIYQSLTDKERSEVPWGEGGRRYK